ncbi:MAG: hypothetical protein N2446_02350 [Elusimicrobiales bacterium]|nr:hypothetical protein [Elusimicrobiales bacterium]
MKIYFNKNKENIIKILKKEIKGIEIIDKIEYLEVKKFKKGYISNFIPKINAVEGVIKIETELNEIVPIICSNNFYFKKPFNSLEKFIIAGPCVINDFEEFEKTILKLLNLNIKIIRSPLFKPRSSPYAWEGFGIEGITKLLFLKKRYKFISVMEILDVRILDKVNEVCDIIQIGARNMRNYVLLKEAAKTHKITLLKRHPYSTLKEFLLSAEYLAKYGSKKIILCERGDSFSDGTPSINLNIIMEIKKNFKIPIIADVSHSAKKSKKVIDFALKSYKIADGIMIEVMENPKRSPIDTSQVIGIEEFKELLAKLK